MYINKIYARKNDKTLCMHCTCFDFIEQLWENFENYTSCRHRNSSLYVQAHKKHLNFNCNSAKAITISSFFLTHALHISFTTKQISHARCFVMLDHLYSQPLSRSLYQALVTNVRQNGLSVTNKAKICIFFHLFQHCVPGLMCHQKQLSCLKRLMHDTATANQEQS